MKSVVLASGASPCTVSRPSAKIYEQNPRLASRPFTTVKFAPTVRRDVTANFFRFGKSKAEEAVAVPSQGRDDYDYDDVEAYFNYMGFLATEGTYDRMEAMLKSGLHYIDIILLLACSENDTPKVQEILRNGADPTVKGLDGKQPLELATKPEVISLLKAALATRGVAV